MEDMKARDLAARLGLIVREETGATMPEGVLPPAREDSITDPTRALVLDSVFRAVQIIQTAAIQLTLDAWRGADALTGDTYPRVLAHPYEDADQSDLITEMVASLALRGNSYVRVIRDDSGQVLSLRPLDPTECTPRLAAGSGIRTVWWRGREYSARDILHTRFLRAPGRAEGLGPIQACQDTILGARNMSRYASNWITEGGVPTGVLTTDQPINKAQAEEAAEQWTAQNSAKDGVAVLGKGLTFTPLMLKPSEVQFLESREFDSRAIARMFGIPAHQMLIGVEGASLTYQNIQDADLSFNRWTEMAYLRPIEAGLSRVLPGRITTRFNLDAFLRPDTRTRYETYKVGIDAGFLTKEYVQETEGLPVQQERTA